VSGRLSSIGCILAASALLAALPVAASASSPKTAAHSDSKEEKQLRVARNHLKNAKTSFALGEYEKAAKEWTYAYKYRPEPDLLFNIAQAYRLAGNREKARMLYESYLRESPNAINRAEVQQYISELTQPVVKDASDAPKKKRTRKKKSEPADS
jgi:tetratricopeptide (TPR) repeat protein